MTEKDLFYNIGTGLGANVDQLLDLTSADIIDGALSIHVGPLHIRRTYVLPEDVANAVLQKPGRIFQMTRDEAVTVFGVEDFLPLTMQRYYNETGDIYYPMHILGIDDTETALKTIGC